MYKNHHFYNKLIKKVDRILFGKSGAFY